MRRPVPKVQAPTGYLKNPVTALSSDSLFLASGSNLINLRTFRPRVVKFRSRIDAVTAAEDGKKIYVALPSERKIITLDAGGSVLHPNLPIIIKGSINSIAASR